MKTIAEQVEALTKKPFTEKIVLVYKDKAFNVFTKKTVQVPDNIKFDSNFYWGSKQFRRIAANSIINHDNNTLYHKRGLPNKGYTFTRYVENSKIRGYISTTVYNDGSTCVNEKDSFVVDKSTDKVLTLSGEDILPTDRIYDLRRNSGIGYAIQHMINGKDINRCLSEDGEQSCWSKVWQYTESIYQKKERLNLDEYSCGTHEIENGFYWRTPAYLIIYENKKLKAYALENGICFKKAATCAFLSQAANTVSVFIPNNRELKIIAQFAKIEVETQTYISQRHLFLLLLLALTGKKVVEETFKTHLEGLAQNLTTLCLYHSPRQGEHLKHYLNLPYNKIRIVNELLLQDKIDAHTVLCIKRANIGSLDNKLFIATVYAYRYELIRNYSTLCSYDTKAKKLDLISNKILTNLLDIEKQQKGAFQVYRDCLITFESSINYLANTFYLPLDTFVLAAKEFASSYIKDLKTIKTYQELVDVHDALIRFEAETREAYASHRDEIEKKRIEQLKEKLQKKPIFLLRKQWQEYQNELFCIINPSYEEIKEEGKVLHHCVGGYAESHLLGNTSIMCLRKKEEPKKPFYTIEITNNAVVQIHGFANKWLGNDPEAIPFVADWLKVNNIQCAKNILLNKAQGYMAAPEQVETQINWSLYPNII